MAWAGSVGVGVLASGVEYFDEPALVLMLASLPREQFRVFSGAQPLSGDFDGLHARWCMPTRPRPTWPNCSVE